MQESFEFFNMQTEHTNPYILLSEKKNHYNVLHPITYTWIKSLDGNIHDKRYVIELDKVWHRKITQKPDYSYMKEKQYFNPLFDSFLINNEQKKTHLNSLCHFLEHLVLGTEETPLDNLNNAIHIDFKHKIDEEYKKLLAEFIFDATKHLYPIKKEEKLRVVMLEHTSDFSESIFLS